MGSFRTSAGNTMTSLAEVSNMGSFRTSAVNSMTSLLKRPNSEVATFYFAKFRVRFRVIAKKFYNSTVEKRKLREIRIN